MPSLSEETGGRVSMLMPGSTIGIIGGGQLGRMMALSARVMAFVAQRVHNVQRPHVVDGH